MNAPDIPDAWDEQSEGRLLVKNAPEHTDEPPEEPGSPHDPGVPVETTAADRATRGSEAETGVSREPAAAAQLNGEAGAAAGTGGERVVSARTGPETAAAVLTSREAGVPAGTGGEPVVSVPTGCAAGAGSGVSREAVAVGRTSPEIGAAAGSSFAGGAEDGRGRRPGGRRGAADPVKALMHRHRELCEHAVDPLEIAAGLEAHGVTDRTAARFRHRDVFSLAEEMFARAPRDGEPHPQPTPTAASGVRADWALLALLPGVLCAATVAGLHLTHGRTRLLVAAGGVLAVSLGVRAVLRRGPLGAPPGTHAWHPTAPTHAWTWWLLGYSLLGDGLLGAAVGGGPDGLPNGTPDGPWPMATAPVLALTLACAPAAWSAQLFAAHARRKLTASRGLDEFSAAVRPLLLGAFALFLCALAALAALCAAALDEAAAYPETLALGALLLLARLLAVHHRSHSASLVLAAAAGAEVLAPALVLAGHLPGCAFLGVPVEALVEHWGAGSVPTLVCTAAALTLLFHATRTLTRASAHAPTGEQT